RRHALEPGAQCGDGPSRRHGAERDVVEESIEIVACRTDGGELQRLERQSGARRQDPGESRPTTQLRGAREVFARVAQPIANGVDEVERQVAGDELKVVSRRPHAVQYECRAPVVRGPILPDARGALRTRRARMRRTRIACATRRRRTGTRSPESRVRSPPAHTSRWTRGSLR